MQMQMNIENGPTVPYSNKSLRVVRDDEILFQYNLIHSQTGHTITILPLASKHKLLRLCSAIVKKNPDLLGVFNSATDVRQLKMSILFKFLEKMFEHLLEFTYEDEGALKYANILNVHSEVIFFLENA